MGLEWLASAKAFKCDVSFTFFFRVRSDNTHQHECFEKFEEHRGRCWPSGAPCYTRCQYQRKPAKLQIPDRCTCTSTIFFTTINLTRLNRSIRRIHPPSALRRPMLLHPPLQSESNLLSKPMTPLFLVPSDVRTYANLEEYVEVEATDLDADGDADVEIDDAPSSATNSKESDVANQSDNAGGDRGPNVLSPF